MCGIAGFISKRNNDFEFYVSAVKLMTNRMKRRGPDAEGLWAAAGIVMGHRRLAILDLDRRANQPLSLENDRYKIVFNGEIYNFRELRRELEGEGVTFITNSDTEVLLALYSRYGEKMLPRLRGMFAIAIWDAHRLEAFLARDPYGIKPLYYSQSENGVAFASQVKALQASGLVSSESELAGLAGFYLWGSIPEPWTLYRGVLSLPAGCLMRVKGGIAEKPECWNNIRSYWQQDAQTHSTEEVQELVRDRVLDSVRAHLVSDVPVSLFLSGGVDSGAIAGLATQLGARLEGVTIAFEEYTSTPNDETPSAALLASHYGIAHHIRRVTRTEFQEDIPLILDAMDQPSIDGVNTWFASKAVAERGYKVALSGVGGDELFYGYSLMREVPRHARIGRLITSMPGGPTLAQAACSYLAAAKGHPKLRGVPEFMNTIEGMHFLRRCLYLPQELPSIMGEEAAHEGLLRLGGYSMNMDAANGINEEGSVSLLESTTYLRNQLLRDSDWASMYHTLELRTPLVDASLAESFKHIHTSFTRGRGKMMLAKSPLQALPQSIVRRRKTGFTLPITQWLTGLAKRSNKKTKAEHQIPWTRQWARVVMDHHVTAK